MEQFTQVSINKKANIYFEGKVTSRTIVFSDGSKKTLGIMLPGEYEFSTSQREIMEFSAGKLDYKLQDGEWQSIDNEGSFEIPANQTFQLKVHEVADYCCSYY